MATTIKNQSFFSLLFVFFSLSASQYLPYSYSTPPYFSMITAGRWVLLQESIGISAMHIQLLRNNKVIIFDRTDFGPSNISLPDGKCRFNDDAIPLDCTAHSVLYDVASNTFRPLMILTNTWCSSGSVNSDGVLVQTGGDARGERVVRTFTPCDDDSCDWIELDDSNNTLFNRRWYSSNQILPDGRIIIVGGRRVFTYEFYPKVNSFVQDNFTLPFLIKTRDPLEENNLYPFLHLLPDGNLFIFASNQSILFDYSRNRVVKEFPVLPGGSRNFPCTGSSVLLPLRLNNTVSANINITMPEAEVMVCGGSKPGAYIKANFENVYVEASRTCGRLKVTDPNPQWVVEFMPMPRIMSDLLLLPTGDVIIINGAANGSAGWNDAVNPVFNPVLYLTEADPSQRFVVLNPTNIPRMYHSTAALLADGRILVGGSNPHPTYNFTAYPYRTELSLEAFYPPYLDIIHLPLRPSILSVESAYGTVPYNEMFAVTFVVSLYREDLGIGVQLMTASFNTHSYGMNQRMVMLNVVSVWRLSEYAHKVNVVGPTNVKVAPVGYYMLFVVHAGIPSAAVWIKLQD
ncbi:aldehyde oxidase GLOX [Mercurialis annua]|uniref:aldehyde oxidase GLOX n=1 Tax=Mercurialis annua TaxID=3986 RepID=UPI00215DEFF4|nr:aldehyde oxidase GLOX [Mercurialis annua]